MERYRRQRGTLPERLEQLAPDFLPEVPIDPFADQPLRYRVDENAYVVYSVGEDGVDDAGKGDENLKPDVVFRVKTNLKSGK